LLGGLQAQNAGGRVLLFRRFGVEFGAKLDDDHRIPNSFPHQSIFFSMRATARRVCYKGVVVRNAALRRIKR
jgi:hypothetical protein